ncbi:methyl-accepting chemotaxis protein [Nitratidesulfovibrio liaohensis]|uniref:Methyl-accepting chemotaxis protein n=1 Tax=Nitratidesulfovibrio liaohensis TaxID=2604158 RepID=A0ABY9QY73_9BACT|nr:methyl-accepting chemotaxis protein [Nitratidesulfovibrio liaohensis]WMW64129.1 methyl-accepting chemotaxis protein [Nitratidesulfovibrio liaohensis]
MFRNFSIGARVIALLVFMVLFVTGVVGAFVATINTVKDHGVTETQQVMLDEEKAKLQVATHSVALALGQLVADVPDETARIELVRKAIDTIRFEKDQSGYYFVYQGTTNVALPPNKSVQGKDQSENKDKNGVYFVRELAQRASSGGGFVEYIFPKPGKGDQPKLAYAEMIPGTKFWIGTGVYIDNIDEAKAAINANLEGLARKALTWQLSVMTAILLLVVIPVCIMLIASIVRPLREATAAAQAVAEGNLEVRIEAGGRDEVSALQAALNTMVATLKNNIADITEKQREAGRQADAARASAQQAEEAMAKAAVATKEGILTAAERLDGVVRAIDHAADDIARRSEEISRGTDTQMARINETATAMEEMNATVLEVARNAGRAADQTEASRTKADEGSGMVSQTVKAMQDLKNLASNLKDNMHRLGQQSEAIGHVMNVINDIADQTNLLALNAAIEAARAGDAGRGFAVVADEVRKLAEKTMGATKEVGDSIKAIQDLARTNVTGMDDAVNAIDGAARLSGSSGELLQQIVTMAHDAAGQVQAIATAAEEQSAASEQITRSVEEIDRIARENGTLVNATNTDLRNLADQAAELRRLIEGMKKEAA